MKILFTRFPLESIDNGGAEKQTLSLMRGLMDRGHAVAFAGSCIALLKACRAEGIPVVEMDIGKPPVTKWEALSFAWRKNGMKQKLLTMLSGFTDGESSRLDCLVMLSLSEKLLLTDVATSRGIHTLWVEHDTVGPWLSKNPWLPLLKKQAAHATMITVSELSKRLYVDMGFSASRIVSIPNGVASALHVQRAEKTADLLRIGCVARLSPEKGVDVLLEAVKDMDGVELSVLGSGPEEAHIRSLATHINAAHPGRVRLLRTLEHIDHFYSRIDLLVLPSRAHDPFGLVAAEAMMRGIPVVVTDTCGISTLLQNGKDAVVVKANDVEALREGIEKFTREKILHAIGDAGSQTAAEKFSVKKMVQRYEEVFTGK